MPDRWLWLLFAGVVSASTGCGLLGDDSPGLDRVRNGGTGPFRSLTSAETLLNAPPEGRIATNFGVSTPEWGTRTFGRVAWTNDDCYVSRAVLSTPVPVRDPGVPEGEPDLGQFEPMHIARCDVTPDALTTTIAETVLTPSEPWEGPDLRDPWPLRLPDGTIRLYYVGDGGIGAADAADPAGPFVRVGSGPLVTPLDVTRPLASPAVVAAPAGGYLMYFDDGHDIFVATSEDGVSFVVVDTQPDSPAIDPLDLSPAIEGETTRLHPGATVAVSVAGRRIVRLYFDVAAEGDANVIMAGSFDGIAFERVALPAYRSDGIASAVPRILSTGETILSLTRPVSVAGVAQRAPVGAVTPLFAFDGGL